MQNKSETDCWEIAKGSFIPFQTIVIVPIIVNIIVDQKIW